MITGPKLVADPAMDWATIARQSFRVIIKAYRADGSKATGYNQTVAVSFDNGSGGKILFGNVTLSAGEATVTGLVLSRVYGTGASRTLYVDDDGCNLHGQIQIAVWFQVMCTREGLVGGTTACSHIITPNDHFVALPATGLCNQPVRVQSGSANEATTVRDVGPWYPYHGSGSGCTNYPADPYWNGTGKPRAEDHIGEHRDCDPSPQTINGAGIDLADGTFYGLGSPTTVLWRFN